MLVCEACLEKQEALRGKDDNGLVIIYCPEHRLLGDGWKEFLQTLKWSQQEIEFAKQSLVRLLDVSEDKVRNGELGLFEVDQSLVVMWLLHLGSKSQGRRKKNLRIQIERIEEWQLEQGQEPTRQEIDDDARATENEFVPFVPFLNI